MLANQHSSHLKFYNIISQCMKVCDWDENSLHTHALLKAIWLNFPIHLFSYTLLLLIEWTYKRFHESYQLRSILHVSYYIPCNKFNNKVYMLFLHLVKCLKIISVEVIYLLVIKQKLYFSILCKQIDTRDSKLEIKVIILIIFLQFMWSKVI